MRLLRKGAALSRIGARADLIAVDGNPLADISLLDGQGEHITHIMKDGVFYKRMPG